MEGCEARVSAEDAIEECRIHEVVAAVREAGKALVDKATGEVIAHVDEEGYIWRRYPRLSRVLTNAAAAAKGIVTPDIANASLD